MAVGHLIATYWPLILVVWGIDRLVRNGARDGLTPLGAILLGAVLTSTNAGLVSLRSIQVWSLVFALAVILVGFEMLGVHWGSRNRSAGHVGPHHRGGRFERIVASELRDMRIRQGLGEVNLDLSSATVPEGETVISVELLIGAIRIVAPSDVPVSIMASAGVGEVRAMDREGSGVDPHVAFEAEGYARSPKRLRLNLHVLVGEAAVTG